MSSNTDFLLAIETSFEMAGQHQADNLFDLFLARRIDLDGEQFAGDPDGGMVLGFDMDVRRAHVNGEF